MAEDPTPQSAVLSILGDMLNRDQDLIGLETSLESLGLDSIMALELIIRVESMLGVTIPVGGDGSHPLNSRSTVSDAVRLFEQLVADRAEGSRSAD